MSGQDFNRDELEHITGQTIGHYQDRAEAFWEGTRDHDVSQNIETLLRHLTQPAPAAILDFGCGPGRDLLTFKNIGMLFTKCVFNLI